MQHRTSKNNVAPLIFIGASAALAAVFCLQPAAKGQSPASDAALDGTVLFSNAPRLPIAANSAPSIAQIKKMPQPSVKRRAARHSKRKKAGARHGVTLAAARTAIPRKLAPSMKAAPAPSNPAPTKATNIPPDSWTDLQDFPWQDVEDKYETDASRFALSEEASSGNVSLEFLGIEKRATFYVLKVAINNDSDADFFIDDFKVLNGNVALESRAIFRVLVEAGNAREGYLLFRPPLTGKSVKVVLKEDGGKGRRLALALSLPF